MLRTLNYKIFNEIANHKEVRPFLGGKGFLDLKSIVENLNNFCFVTDEENGGYIVINKGTGSYEVHTFSYPCARGKTMFKLMRQARAFMFLRTDCIELQTYVPEGLTNINLWASNSGFREDFKRENCFDLDGTKVGLTYYSMSYEDWVLKDIDNKIEGQNFHTVIEANHEDDDVHDYWAGATYRAVKNFNYIKAISFYNKWANRTGYAPISVVSVQPLVVNIESHILALNGTDIIVLKVPDKCPLEPLLVEQPH